jgi:hypothetical protein
MEYGTPIFIDMPKRSPRARRDEPSLAATRLPDPSISQCRSGSASSSKMRSGGAGMTRSAETVSLLMRRR